MMDRQTHHRSSISRRQKTVLIRRRRHGSVIVFGQIFLVFFLLPSQTNQSNWWYLGLSSSVDQNSASSSKLSFRDRCLQVGVLEDHQKEMCSKAKNVLSVVTRGATSAIEECQHQFSYSRWNCTTFDQSQTKTVFGNVLARKSREKAYIYAISSAGVLHAITKACSKGEIQMCSCDLGVRNKPVTDGDFTWGGCSHDVKFGDRFTREFVDESENPNDEEGRMNLWNNEAGRKTVSGNMKLLCKCHGVSGSCSAKICWRTVATFREIGDQLKDRFDGAIRVKFSPNKMKLRPVDRLQKRPTRGDLVYLDQSPDYCEHRPDVGSLGTTGRECNRTSYGLDGCQLMCCGRGHRTFIEDVSEDCNCKFFWCCRVECQTCVRKMEKYYCN